jgi:hypothetical protein
MRERECHRRSNNFEINFWQVGKPSDERQFEVMVGKSYLASGIGLDSLQKCFGVEPAKEQYIHE